ncbi:MAG: MAPEG family protein [Myxococcota bacterium]
MPHLVATPLYTALLALLALVLSVRVIKVRQSRKISLGTDGNEELTRAVRAHANLTEHMPLAILMMAFLELNDGHAMALHAAGISLVVGRLVHAWALPAGWGQGRVAGMALTFGSWIVLALANVATVLL